MTADRSEAAAGLRPYRGQPRLLRRAGDGLCPPSLDQRPQYRHPRGRRAAGRDAEGPRHGGGGGADGQPSDGARPARRLAGQADDHALRPLRRAAAGPAGAVGRARPSSRRSATGASMRAASATTRASILPSCWRSSRIWRFMATCPATSSSCWRARRKSAARTSPASSASIADRLKADLVVTSDGPLHEIRPADRHLRRARRGQLRAALQDGEPRRPFRQFRRRRAQSDLDAGPASRPR